MIEDEMVGWNHHSMDMHLNNQETVRTGDCHAAVHGVAHSWIGYVTEQQQQQQHIYMYQCVCVCVCVCKSLQLCLTLCDPINCSPPGSPVHGILQARILGYHALIWVICLPNSGIKPAFFMSPALAGGFFTTRTPLGSPIYIMYNT